MEGKTIYIVKKRRLNGKVYYDKARGCDCSFFRWHQPCADSLTLYSQCHYGDNTYYKDCKYYKSPEYCPYFEIKKIRKQKGNN